MQQNNFQPAQGIIIMRTEQKSLIHGLLSQDEIQLAIPIYQRPYSWATDLCERLWDDALMTGQDEDYPEHFFGAIIHTEFTKPQGKDGIKYSDVIDGQQRLVTIFLLMMAMRDYLQKNMLNPIINSEAENEFWDSARDITKRIQRKLKNGECYEPENEVRLKLTDNGKYDRKTFEYYFDPAKNQTPSMWSEQIRTNYDFFYKKLEKCDKQEIGFIWSGLNRFVIIDVVLEERDDPQRIFESWNSVRVPLTQADLIRNFILMGLTPDKQKDLFDRLWNPIEEDFNRPIHKDNWQITIKQEGFFDKFIRDFLIVSTEKLIKVGNVYNDFKHYFVEKEKSAEFRHQDRYTICEDLAKKLFDYSDIFIKLATNFHTHLNTDALLKTVVMQFNLQNKPIFYPFLLKLFNLHHQGQLEQNELLKILIFIENYLFRRDICGLPSNGLDDLVVGLIRLQRCDYQHIREHILNISRRDALFPSDSEFQKAFAERKNTFTQADKKGIYIFMKLENYQQKVVHDHAKYLLASYIIPADYQQESWKLLHVMPVVPHKRKQQIELLPSSWQKMLGENWGEIQETKQHCIGNLMLCYDDQNIDDKSDYQAKQDYLNKNHANSFWVNAPFAKCEQWTEKEIDQRAQLLAEQAVKVWFRADPEDLN